MPHDRRASILLLSTSDTDLLARLFNTLAVHANISRFDQGLRRGAAFHQPDAVEIEIEPHVPNA